jgi:hypothetical protein
MEFVTIHDLSRELNVPARVIRYRLIHLIADGKLKEQEDFRRDDFKDDQHFFWKINPLSFMRETGLKTDAPVNHADNHLVTPDTKIDNQPNSIKPEPPKLVNQSDNQPPPSVNESGNKEPSLEREMIDLLKDQIKVKDGQLHEQGEQLKDLNDLNVKLTGTMLRQNEKIENLLRLTGGKSDVVNKEAGSVDQPQDQGSMAEAA